MQMPEIKLNDFCCAFVKILAIQAKYMLKHLFDSYTIWDEKEKLE